MAAYCPIFRSHTRNKTLTILAVLAALAAAGPNALADYSFQTLYTFAYSDGATPSGGVIADAQGNLYGTTSYGGANNSGIVYKLSAGANPTFTTLATFNNGGNGAHPQGNLIADAQGNLYGTTNNGGADASGTIFKVSAGANPTLTTVVTFNGSNGQLSHAGMIADAQGNLYGTTSTSVFELTTGANPTLTTLASISNSYGGLVFDSHGNLYGTTYSGGPNGEGTVFKLTTGATPTLTTLLTFNGTNGKTPYAGVIIDAQGNLYGTTGNGGANNDGTVFKLTTGATPTLTTLLTFNGSNGEYPEASLYADAQGNLYGTTGGATFGNYGNVFELSPTAASVPEPASYLIMAQGCAVMVGFLIRSQLRRPGA